MTLKFRQVTLLLFLMKLVKLVQFEELTGRRRGIARMVDDADEAVVPRRGNVRLPPR